MGISKYVSDIQVISQNTEIIYNYLSDFENISRYLTDDILSTVSEKVPQFRIDNFVSDRDSCSFNIGGLGTAGISIVDREPFRTIKMKGNGSMPADLTFWIQLLPVDPYKTKMRLTLHAELGMMIRMMVGNKLEEGINKLAETLAKLPYS